MAKECGDSSFYFVACKVIKLNELVFERNFDCQPNVIDKNHNTLNNCRITLKNQNEGDKMLEILIRDIQHPFSMK